MPKILIIGDTSGSPDEGMKKASKELSHLLDLSMNVRLASVADILRNTVSFRKIDIIHYMAGPSWRSFFYAFFLKQILGRKAKTIISFIHPKWSILAGVFFRVFKPDAVIVQSRKWKQYCHDSGVLMSDELMLGVNLKKFSPVSIEQRNEIRKLLNLPLDKKILLHVGHLNPGRNLSLMTRFKEDRDVLPVVIGSTTVCPDTKIVNSLEDAGVKIIHEYLDNIEMFYQAADCYIFPVVDPHCCIQIPLSVLEALACGIPTVATRFEGLPYFLPNEFPGLNYLDDPATIHASVQHLLCSNVKPDPEMLHEFSWNRIVTKLEGFYQRILTS